VRTARRTWRDIGERIGKLARNPNAQSLNKELAEATRRGALAEAERIAAEQSRARKERQAQAYERLRSEGVDAELLDAHARLAALDYTNRVQRAAIVRQLARRLGGIPPEEHGSRSSAPRYDARGYARRHGLFFESWLTFKDATTGFPALADWLCGQDCNNLRYDLHAGPAFFDDDEE
jgi:hypothetical protein